MNNKLEHASRNTEYILRWVASDGQDSRRMGPWEYVQPEFLVNDADAFDDAAGTCGSGRWVSRWTKLTDAFRGTIKFHAHCIPLECPIVVDIYELTDIIVISPTSRSGCSSIF